MRHRSKVSGMKGQTGGKKMQDTEGEDERGRRGAHFKKKSEGGTREGRLR